MSPPERKRRELPAGEAITDAMAELLSLVPELTEEQWRERDADIAAAGERGKQDVLRSRLAELEGAGFPQRALAVVRSGVDERAPGIVQLRNLPRWQITVLSGTKGCGKTVAATWWASQRSCTVRFVKAARFATTSRYKERDQHDEWCSAPLVLDDLGTEFVDQSGSFSTDLDALVDSFYDGMRALVITTNCTVADFRLRYGDRISDRLAECGRWISLTGASLRRPQPRGTAP